MRHLIPQHSIQGAGGVLSLSHTRSLSLFLSLSLSLSLSHTHTHTPHTHTHREQSFSSSGLGEPSCSSKGSLPAAAKLCVEHKCYASDLIAVNTQVWQAEANLRNSTKTQHKDGQGKRKGKAGRG